MALAIVGTGLKARGISVCVGGVLDSFFHFVVPFLVLYCGFCSVACLIGSAAFRFLFFCRLVFEAATHAVRLPGPEGLRLIGECNLFRLFLLLFVFCLLLVSSFVNAPPY